QYVMEACAEKGIELIILDRPNPNGFYVDGPILEPGLKSFVGMNPIPIVHGLTVGEYAQMLNGEGWLEKGLQCRLKVIRVANYSHALPYTLPIPPSPNLNSAQSVLLYPSLCLFEGTSISQGRGTLFPFTVLGSPALAGKYSFSFTPKSIPGMSENPPHKDKVCYGMDLRKYNTNQIRNSGKLNLQWHLELYQAHPVRSAFFRGGGAVSKFDRRAGTKELRKQLMAGMSDGEIRQSWEPGLSQYKLMRKKYLLYE